MTLKNIFCQDKAVELLQSTYANGKWPHAYIFAGPKGIGKFTTASAWAKLLLCQKPDVEKNFADACGRCQSCKLFEADSHPDFIHIYKELSEFTEDGKDKKTPIDLPIDVIREFLIAKASQKPILSNRKVFIVSEAEKLNPNSQNAMLKILEEPPDYCSMVLLCCAPEKLLPTVKSRCQTVKFGLIEEEIIIKMLIKTGLDKTVAKSFARLAQGSIGQAKSWAELESAGAELYKTKTGIVETIADYQYSQSLDLAGQFLEKAKSLAEIWAKQDQATSKSDINRRALKTIVRIIILTLNDVARCGLIKSEQFINFDQKEQIEKLSKKLDTEKASVKITECCRSLDWLDSNVNEKLVFEQLLLNLADSDTIGV